MIREGQSLRQISRATGAKKTTIYYYMQKIRGGKSRVKPLKISGPLENIGEFVGVFEGDGSFCKDALYHYSIRITLSLKEKEYAKKLKAMFASTFGDAPYEYTQPKITSRVLRYQSKKMLGLLQSYLHWFKGDKTGTVRLHTINHPTSFCTGFLRGLFDTDGYRGKSKACFATISYELAS